MRPRGHDAREHTACGPPSAAQPLPLGVRARVGHRVRRGPTARAMGL